MKRFVSQASFCILAKKNSSMVATQRTTKKDRGFTLVELMVALAIGLLLTIGVVQIFSASRSTYQLDEGLARAQENGRFAIEFMTREIRHAAHLGCRRSVTVFNTLVGAPLHYSVNGSLNGVLGHEYNATSTAPGSTYSIPSNPTNTSTGWSPALPTTATAGGGAIPGSDVIGIERFIPTPINIAAATTLTPVIMVPPAQANLFEVDDILMVADCIKATIFQVTDVNLATGALSHDLGGGPPGNRCGVWEHNVTGSGNAAGDACTEQIYESNAIIGQIASVFFYVAQDPANNNRSTLFQSVIPPRVPAVANALVEGVENIQILYGVDDNVPIDGTPERYLIAENVPNFASVVSVKLSILVTSVNATGSATDQAIDTDTYNLVGTIVDPQDDRLKRRVFSTTIQLRNRGV